MSHQQQALHGWLAHMKSGHDIDLRLSGGGPVSDVEMERRAAKVCACVPYGLLTDTVAIRLFHVCA
jgi:hypothetical protein